MSRPHYFYNVMRKTIIQFCDVFNNIIVARYDSTGTITKYVSVPLKFAPKTKQWYMEERVAEGFDRVDPVFPMMAIELESLEFATDRQVNRNYKITAANDGAGTKQFYNAVPYDFNFKLMIAAEYTVDITQVVEQIFPFFTPEAYIRLTIPELNIEGLNDDGSAGSDKLELKVLYESSSKEETVELDEASYRVLQWDLTFKVQGYLFSPSFDSKPAYHIVTPYYLSDAAWAERSADTTLQIGELGSQTMQGHLYATYIPKENRASVIEVTDQGSTYGTATYTTSYGGAGTGLTVDVVDNAGVIDTATINTSGEGYTVGDIVTVDGGDSLGTLTITAIDNEPVDDTIREMFEYEHFERI